MVWGWRRWPVHALSWAGALLQCQKSLGRLHAAAPFCGEISAHTAVPVGAVMSSCPRRAGVLDPEWLTGSAEMQNAHGMAPQATETFPDVRDLGWS